MICEASGLCCTVLVAVYRTVLSVGVGEIWGWIGGAWEDIFDTVLFSFYFYFLFILIK